MKRKWYYTIVVLQVLFLFIMAGSYYAVDYVGEEIKLKTEPIDPRDLFYGDYVTLNYEISQLPLALWQGGAQEPEENQVIYVELAPSDGFYNAVNVHAQNKAIPAEHKMLKGQLQYSWDNQLRVRYGLERYYVPEGTGQDIEDNLDNMIVTVKITPWGQKKISDIHFE